MTNIEWVALLQAMTVSGVSKYYDYPPESVDLSGGPAAFPALLTTTRGEPIGTCPDMSKTREADYCVIIAPVAQGNNESNYAMVPWLLEALEIALDNLVPELEGVITYTIRLSGNYDIGGVAHWALIASVTWRAA